MGLEKHVGRVGALAVALGIGSAVVAMPGVAWASPDTASAGTSSDSAAVDPGGPAKVTHRPSRSEGSKDAAASTDTVGSGEGTSTTPKRGKRAAATDTRDAKRAAADEQSSAEETDTTAPPKTRRHVAGSLSQTQNTEAPTTPSAPGLVTASVADEPDALAPKVATVLRSLFSPQVSAHLGDEPEAPEASPLLWTMLAYARRQFGEHTATAESAAGSSIAATADVNANLTSAVIPGNSYQSPVIGADGTTYQVTSDFGGSTRVTVLDSNGRIVATSREIPGSQSDVLRAVARPDGTLIVLTYKGLGSRTFASSVDSQGTVTRVATVTGELDEPMVVGANGALYFSTSRIIPIGAFPPYVGVRSFRISPTNIVRTFPHDTEVQVGPDGSAYLVSSQFGLSTLRAIASNGTTRTILLPFGSEPGAPILGQDWTVYVTAGVTPLGGQQTRLYTVTATSSTVRTITGLPGDTVVAVDGLYLETFTDNGTTYLSRITATTLDTSDVIGGRIAGLQVAPDGTIYAPVNDTSSDTTDVAVVDGDGTVTTVSVPGKLVVGDRNVGGGGSQGSDGRGYVNYSADGTEYVAVLNPDATIARTIELPEGASGSSVFYDPDGAAYEMLVYPDAEGHPESRQILGLATSTYTANVLGTSYYGNAGVDDVVFGPDGIGYLLTGTLSGLPGNSENLDVLGFGATGDTVIRASGLLSPVVQVNTFGGTQGRCLGLCGSQVLAFDPDGTAYVTVYNSQADPNGVYALTPSGTVRVADLEYVDYYQGNLPVFAPDGTGYVTTGSYYGTFQSRTTVTVFTPTA